MTTPCSMIFVFSVMEMDAYYGYKMIRVFELICAIGTQFCGNPSQAQYDNYGGIEITEIYGN